MTPERLLIVYNAEAGIVAGIRDSLHKLLRPETYPCNLCALTHGLVRQDPNWTRFLAKVPVDVEVYHRRDFRARYPDLDMALPAVLVERGGEARVLIGAEQLRAIETVDCLIGRLETKLTVAVAR